MLNAEGVMRMPKQDISTLASGTTAGYIGDDIGEVETYEPKKPGDTNVAPDLPSAQAAVKAAELALKRAQKALSYAEEKHSTWETEDPNAAKTPKPNERVVGGAAVP